MEPRDRDQVRDAEATKGIARRRVESGAVAEQHGPGQPAAGRFERRGTAVPNRGSKALEAHPHGGWPHRDPERRVEQPRHRADPLEPKASGPVRRPGIASQQDRRHAQDEPHPLAGHEQRVESTGAAVELLAIDAQMQTPRHASPTVRRADGVKDRDRAGRDVPSRRDPGLDHAPASLRGGVAAVVHGGPRQGGVRPRRAQTRRQTLVARERDQGAAQQEPEPLAPPHGRARRPRPRPGHDARRGHAGAPTEPRDDDARGERDAAPDDGRLARGHDAGPEDRPLRQQEARKHRRQGERARHGGPPISRRSLRATASTGECVNGRAPGVPERTRVAGRTLMDDSAGRPPAAGRDA